MVSARTKGKAVLCVPGGTTPGPVFDLLSEVDLDWGSVYVMLNDERWVNEDSERSNTALLRRRLLRGKARSAHLVPLYAEAEMPEEQPALRGYRAESSHRCLLLGMGADMHTASLFPGADLLEEALADDAPVLMALRAEAAASRGSPHSTGAQRRDAHPYFDHRPAETRSLDRAKSLSPTEAPVAAILPMQLFTGQNNMRTFFDDLIAHQQTVADRPILNLFENNNRRQFLGGIRRVLSRLPKTNIDETARDLL